jgi:hypothetical protein
MALASEPSCTRLSLCPTARQERTYGEVTPILVDKAGEDRFDLFCLASEISATRLLRVWSRHHLIAQVCRLLKHLLAPECLPGPR